MVWFLGFVVISFFMLLLVEVLYLEVFVLVFGFFCVILVWLVFVGGELIVRVVDVI